MSGSPIEIHAAHPSFDGHFPGRPILPGALLLDAALAVILRERGLALLDWRIAAAKFLGPVEPGEALEVDHDATPGGQIQFQIRTARGTVASGRLAPA